MLAALVLGAVALIVRVALAAWWIPRHDVSRAGLIGDEPGYNNIALELIQGFGFTWAGRVPLYPVWVAGVHLLTGEDYAALRYAQTALGAAAVVLTYFLARQLFDRRAAAAAGALAAVDHVLASQALHVMSEVLFTPLAVLATLLLVRAWQRPSVRHFAVAGACVGVSALVRPTLLLFPAFAAVVLLAHGRSRSALRHAAAYALAAALVMVPWAARNRVKFGAWFPLQTSNAILWQGSPEYYRLVREQGYTYVRVWREVLYGPGWREHDPTSVDGDRYWTRRAVRSITGDPATYALYALEKAATYWVGDPNADWNDERVFSYGALRRAGMGAPEATVVLLWRLLPLAALAAAVVLRRHARRLLPLYLVLAYCTLLHAATHAEVRLSEPLHPLLLVLVGGAAIALLDGRRARGAQVDVAGRDR